MRSLRDKIGDKVKDSIYIKTIWGAENYSQLVGYEFYVVDENGRVISSSTLGMLEIDKVQIIDGARNYQISKSDPNVFKIAGCDSIKNGCLKK